MKRLLLGSIGVIALIFTAAPPAQADFHLPTQACASGVGDAHVSLKAVGPNLEWAGSVRCPGATSVTITSVTFTPQVTGTQQTGGPASCGPCDNTPLVVSGTAPGTPGIYDVRLVFTAVGPGGTYNLGRKMRWAYAGTGQPTVVCNNQGAVRCPN